MMSGKTIASLLLVLPFSFGTQAATVSDVDESDLNIVNSVTRINDPAGLGRIGINVQENYGENTLVPYTSHDGYAIVNALGGHFDKVLTITADDAQPQFGGWDSMFINFQVTNATSRAWSDFHLEFYNADFTQVKGLTLLWVGVGTQSYPYFGNDFFDLNSQYGDFGGSALHFWSGDKQLAPNEVLNVWLRWDWGNPGDDHDVGDAIGIRQIATAVPEPANVLMMLAGLAALGLAIPRCTA